MSNTYPVRFDTEPGLPMNIGERRERGINQLTTLLVSEGASLENAQDYVAWLSTGKAELKKDLILEISSGLREKYAMVLINPGLDSQEAQFDLLEQDMLGLVFGRTPSAKDAPMPLRDAMSLISDAREGEDLEPYEHRFWEGIEKLTIRYHELPKYIKERKRL